MAPPPSCCPVNRACLVKENPDKKILEKMPSRSVDIENFRLGSGFTPTWVLKSISAFETSLLYEFIYVDNVKMLSVTLMNLI